MHDEESKRMLRQTLEISRENNKLLKKMRRTAIWGNVFRLIWWAILIGVPIYLYFTFLQPVFEGLNSQLEGVQGGVEGVKGFIDRILNFGDIFGSEQVTEEGVPGNIAE